MYQPNEERLHNFWRALQDMWLQLYMTPLATIAAINVRHSVLRRKKRMYCAGKLKYKLGKRK